MRQEGPKCPRSSYFPIVHLEIRLLVTIADALAGRSFSIGPRALTVDAHWRIAA